MDVVIDTSAVIAVVIFERQRKFVLKALRGARWMAAPSLPWEVGSALVRMMKARRIGADQAVRAWGHFAQLTMEYVQVDVVEALSLSARRGMHAYDAYVLDVARRMQLPMITLDQAQARHAEAMGISVIEISA